MKSGPLWSKVQHFGVCLFGTSPHHGPVSRRQGPTPAWVILSAVAVSIFLTVLQESRQPAISLAMDGALALSGLVPFPPDSVMAQYYLGSWTMLHQIGALLLKVGVGYVAANYVLLCLAPVLLTVSLVMVIFSLTQRATLSLILGTIGFLTAFGSIHFASPDYPLLGARWSDLHSHTFGTLGATIAAFVLAAITDGRRAMASFAAVGLMAVHPVLGAYASGLVLLAIFLEFLWSRQIAKAYLWGGLSGALLTTASFAAFIAMRPAHLPITDAHDLYFKAYMTNWDAHRTIPLTLYFAVKMVCCSFLLAAISAAVLRLRRGRHELADLGIYVTIASIIISTSFYYVGHIFGLSLPRLFVATIPGRFINIHAYLTPAILFASAFCFVRDGMPASPEIPPSFERPGSVWQRLGVLFHPLSLQFLLLAGLAVLSLFQLRYVLGAAIGMAHSIASGNVVPSAFRKFEEPFWTNVRARHLSLTLTPPFGSGNILRFGRTPVALDASAFDFVAYLPSTAEFTGHLVENAYGVDFFSPPADLRNEGSLSTGPTKTYWQCLSKDNWIRIGRQFKVANVIAPTGWHISLPYVISGPEFTVFQIPAEQKGPVLNVSPGTCPLMHS